MATLVAPTSVKQANGARWSSKYGIYTFNTTDSSLTWLHFKTNIPTNTEAIGMFEAQGYMYSGGYPVRCSWGFYVYNGGVSHRGLESTSGNGLTPDGIYKSSDNYLCLRATGNTYFVGFVLNVHMNLHYYDDVSITAANQNNTSGNYY